MTITDRKKLFEQAFQSYGSGDKRSCFRSSISALITDPWWSWPLYAMGSSLLKDGQLKLAAQFFRAFSSRTPLAPEHPWMLRAAQIDQLSAKREAPESSLYYDQGGELPLCLTVIARDEERVIQRMISSIQPLRAAQLILVDTGSKDSTPDIAQRAGFRVISRTWDGDYAAPRNVALEACEQPWCCYFDCDDVLEPGSAAKIRSLVLTGRASSFNSFRLRQGPASLAQIRLWKNAQDVRFRPRVHERLWPSEEPTFHSDIIVDHLDDPETREARRAERFQALIDAQASDPEANYWDFHLAMSLALQQDYVGASRHASVYLAKRGPEAWDRAVLYAKYLISWCDTHVNGDTDRAVPQCASCLIESPESAELWCLMGDAMLRSGRALAALSFYGLARAVGAMGANNPWLTDSLKYDEYPASMEKLVTEQIGGDSTVSSVTAGERKRELAWIFG